MQKNKDLRLEKDFRPICTRFVKETNKGLKYELDEREIELEMSAADRKISVNFLYLCNGKEKIDDIAEELGVKTSRLWPLVNILIQYNIISDSRNLYKFYRQVESVPGPFLNNLQKSSIYKKFNNTVLPPEKIEKVLSLLTTNSVKNNDLEYYIVINPDYKSLRSGLYKLDISNGKLKRFAQKTTPKLNKFLLASEVAENSSVLIFIVGNEKSMHNYPNRTYRHLFLQSGHVSQTILQLAEKENFCLVEYSDFNDKAVSKFLGINSDQFCTIALILGEEKQSDNYDSKNSCNTSYQEKVNQLKKFLTEKGFLKQIETKYYQNSDYAMQKYATMATSFKIHKNDRTYTTCGVGDTIVESELKCLVEMYERYASGLIRVDKSIIFNGQQNFFSITLNAPQHRKFLNKKKLQLISTDKKVKCVRGIGLINKKKYYIPIDEVFYPNKKAIFYKANSSGVAAHYDKELAIRNALYELVERDAVLVTWYAKRIPNILDKNYLSDDIKRRVLELKKNKCRIDFLDLTIDSCPVILCIIHSPKYPQTCIGCSANVEVEKAIEKSLDEAELMLNTWNEEADSNRFVEIEDIENTIDHGNILARNNLEKSDYKWLLTGKKVKSVKPKITDFNLLVKKFQPKQIDINKKTDLGLYVVRVMSEKLLPLTFGYGGEHYGHARLKELNLKWCGEYPSLPHFIP